jgi:hypothetical protein
MALVVLFTLTATETLEFCVNDPLGGANVMAALPTGGGGGGGVTVLGANV